MCPRPQPLLAQLELALRLALLPQLALALHLAQVPQLPLALHLARVPQLVLAGVQVLRLVVTQLALVLHPVLELHLALVLDLAPGRRHQQQLEWLPQELAPEFGANLGQDRQELLHKATSPIAPPKTQWSHLGGKTLC